MSNLSKFKDDLGFLVFKSRKPLVWLETFDYNLVMNLLREALPNAEEGNEAIWIWNASNQKVALYNVNSSNKKESICNSNEKESEDSIQLGELIPLFNLGKFPTEQGNWVEADANVLIACVSEYLFEEDGFKYGKRLLARLQEFVYKNLSEKDIKKKRCIILISTHHFDVPGLNHIFERLILPMPDYEDIDEILGFATYVNKSNETYSYVDGKVFKKIHIGNDVEAIPVAANASKGIIIRNEYNRVVDYMIPSRDNLPYPFGGDILDENNFKDYYQELTDSLCGMHLMDIKELLSTLKLKGNGKIIYDYVEGGKRIELPKIISDRKKQIVNNSGLLEVVDYEDNYYENVADIDNIRNHIKNEKKRIDNPGNYPPKFPKPKGILLVGAPGCGKSESAKAIASQLNKPLYRLNIGSLLGHKYGQSENKFIEALRTADASAPCVLWIDEIEKAFAGAGNESENDDTLTHIVGHFLTWMQEHKTMVYLVATANDLSRMKPEMLRKGRWDERFYLSYPSQQGCERILYAITQKKLKVRVSFKNSDVFMPEKSGYTIKEETKERLDIITKIMHTMQMSGAEIENVIIKAINNHPIPKDGKWYVDLDDIGDTIISEIISLKYCPKWIKPEEEEAFNELKEKLKKVIKSNPQKKFSDEILKEMARFGDRGKDVDYFLNKQIDEDILNAQINRCEKWGNSDEDIKKRKNLYDLLLEKYREKYCFTPACIN